jgi:hypothetical protein
MIQNGPAMMGLDGPIPEGQPGHRIAPHVELREFPTRYLTPQINRLVRLHELHAAGLRLRDDGVLHWPASLVQALTLLDREMALRRAHAQRR